MERVGDSDPRSIGYSGTRRQFAIVRLVTIPVVVVTLCDSLLLRASASRSPVPSSLVQRALLTRGMSLLPHSCFEHVMKKNQRHLLGLLIPSNRINHTCLGFTSVYPRSLSLARFSVTGLWNSCSIVMRKVWWLLRCMCCLFHIQSVWHPVEIAFWEHVQNHLLYPTVRTFSFWIKNKTGWSIIMLIWIKNYRKQTQFIFPILLHRIAVINHSFVILSDPVNGYLKFHWSSFCGLWTIAFSDFLSHWIFLTQFLSWMSFLSLFAIFQVSKLSSSTCVLPILASDSRHSGVHPALIWVWKSR